jgi:DNA-binding GntR family transcriptional regulator
MAERDQNTEGKADALYADIKADLMAWRFAAGARISEASLSRHYGVSRSPIREATTRLESDGLLERQGMIVRVRQRTFEEVIDIYRVRVFLEGAIAGDAAARRREIDVMRMRAALDAEVGVNQDDPLAVAQANNAFHQALGVAAHNVTLIDLQSRLLAQVSVLPSTTLSYPGRWPEAHREHEQILRAVEICDVGAARTIAETHMGRAREIRLKMFEHDFAEQRDQEATG